MARARGDGDGAILRRLDGRWEARTPRFENGKRRYFYGKTKKEVAAKLREAQAAREQGRLLANPSEPLSTFLDRWLTDVVALRDKYTTLKSYRLNVERVKPHIGYVRLDTLKGAHLDQCYRALLDRGLSKSSVSQTHRTLRAAFRYAVRADLLAVVPSAAATAPRSARKEMQTLTAEQAASLFRVSETDRMHALWVLLINTGLRVGEATALRWEDVDLAASTLSVRYTLYRKNGEGLILGDVKTTHSRRTVSLSPSVACVLTHHRDRQMLEARKAADQWHDRGFLFMTEVGLPLDPRYVRDVFIRTLIRADLPRIRVHDLRHTCASLLLSQGVHPKVVQELLGHSSITVTMDIYSHVLPTLHAQAALMMESVFAAF